MVAIGKLSELKKIFIIITVLLFCLFFTNYIILIYLTFDHQGFTSQRGIQINNEELKKNI